MIASISPTAIPALKVAGALFVIIHVLAAVWAWRHRRQLFGPDSGVTGDRSATRLLQVIVLSIPWLFLTFRLVVAWVGLWFS